MESSLFDIGANLTHASFADDLADLLTRARQAGVTSLSVTSSTLADCHQAIALIEHTGDSVAMSTTVGFHPHYASRYSRKCFNEMLEICAHTLVRAVGETGLDYYRNHSTPEQQQRSFEDHMELAATTRLPMFLHQRDAHERFTEMLATHRDSLGRVVVHCFTGDKNMLYQYLDMDCYIGITGWINDPRRGAHLLPLVADIPRNRLLVETDCPYLLPQQFKKKLGRRNEPACLPAVVDMVAQYRSETAEQLADITNTNAKNFFATISSSPEKKA